MNTVAIISTVLTASALLAVAAIVIIKRNSSKQQYLEWEDIHDEGYDLPADHLSGTPEYEAAKKDVRSSGLISSTHRQEFTEVDSKQAVNRTKR